jgi:hypothetical protein
VRCRVSPPGRKGLALENFEKHHRMSSYYIEFSVKSPAPVSRSFPNLLHRAHPLSNVPSAACSPFPVTVTSKSRIPASYINSKHIPCQLPYKSGYSPFSRFLICAKKEDVVILLVTVWEHLFLAFLYDGRISINIFYIMLAKIRIIESKWCYLTAHISQSP